MTPAVRDIILSNRVAWSWMGDGSRVWDFTRAGDGMRVNSAGVLETIGTNGLRYDFDPTTGSLRGVLIEPARANGIRNNTMAGASAGTPGTLPTHWSRFTSLTGLSSEIVSIGSNGGIDTMRFRLFGTPSGTGQYQVFFDTSTGIPALTGQVTAMAVFMRSIGALTNVSVTRIGWDENTSGGVFVTNKQSPGLSITTTLARFSYVATNNGGGTVAAAFPYFLIGLTSGDAVDVTYEIGWPGIEIVASGASVATSPIRTTGSAATRAVDALSLPIPPGTYSVGVVGGTVLQAGTTYTDTVTVTGTAWDFAWPTAAITAGERHLQRVSMRRIG